MRIYLLTLLLRFHYCHIYQKYVGTNCTVFKWIPCVFLFLIKMLNIFYIDIVCLFQDSRKSAFCVALKCCKIYIVSKEQNNLYPCLSFFISHHLTLHLIKIQKYQFNLIRLNINLSKYKFNYILQHSKVPKIPIFNFLYSSTMDSQCSSLPSMTKIISFMYLFSSSKNTLSIQCS